MTAKPLHHLFVVDSTPQGIIQQNPELDGACHHRPAFAARRLRPTARAGRTKSIPGGREPHDSALKPLVYIGETDNVGKRLVQHNKDDGKDFFDRFCVVTSKDRT